MKTSFVIITLNGRKTIKNTVDSIMRLDGLKDFEIVVINDGSTDTTEELVKKMSVTNKAIKIFTNPKNRGRGFSRNEGVKRASGEYIAFVDDDIELPNNWLVKCEQEIKNYDAVGGIAIPDGDVNFVYKIFNLNPKVIAHTTSITGNNGLFKKTSLQKVSPDPLMRDGEDVDLTWRFTQFGLKSKSISKLICLHKEAKSFTSSIIWLYEQGAGSNRLLAKYRKFRLPDLTFLSFLILIVVTLLTAYQNSMMILVPFIYCLMVSFVHIYSKFNFSIKNIVSFVLASVVHSIMIAAYFIGRLSNLYILAIGK